MADPADASNADAAGSPAERERPSGNGSSDDEASTDQPTERPDGGVTTHTIRLELVDEPGELLAALEPIAANGGNLLSIFHERGNRTPRGRIPVEVDLSCPPDRFDPILADLRESGVNVVEAGERRYADEATVLLVGDLLGAGVSEVLERVDAEPAARVSDVTLDAVEEGPASARLRVRAREGRLDEALAALRAVAAEKSLRVIEPLGVRG